MIKVGYVQKLVIVKMMDKYALLKEKGENPNNKNSEEESAVLAKRFFTDDMKVGGKIEVFVYKDDEKLIATTKRPRLTLGDVGFLKVIEISPIGAFLDNGIEKDLLLPHAEQTSELKNGGDYMVSMYVDRSGRLCATMNVYDSLSTEGKFKVDDRVEGTVISMRRGLGAMIAVEGKYLGMILEKAIRGYLHIGEKISLQVIQVREDGKLILVQAGTTAFKVDTQSERVYQKLGKKGGFLPYNDKSSPAKIYDEFHLSKSEFKKAIGSLYRKRMIVITKAGIELPTKENSKFEYKDNNYKSSGKKYKSKKSGSGRNNRDNKSRSSYGGEKSTSSYRGSSDSSSYKGSKDNTSYKSGSASSAYKGSSKKPSYKSGKGGSSYKTGRGNSATSGYKSSSNIRKSGNR